MCYTFPILFKMFVQLFFFPFFVGCRLACVITAFFCFVGTALRCITLKKPYSTWYNYFYYFLHYNIYIDCLNDVCPWTILQKYKKRWFAVKNETFMNIGDMASKECPIFWHHSCCFFLFLFVHLFSATFFVFLIKCFFSLFFFVCLLFIDLCYYIFY